MKQSPLRSEPVTGKVSPFASDANHRLTRLRRLAWLLDRSIPIGGYRIGLDPILGLLPGVGDTLMAATSVVILYDAARLGLPVRILLLMLGNVVIDALVGAIPVLGDLFDFAWQANARNLQLVERHYDPIRAERPASRITHAIAIFAVLLVIGGLVLTFFVLRALWRLIENASA